MASIEIIEIYGIRINRKEAVLLQILMEHKDNHYRHRAMCELEQSASPETLQFIVMNHPDNHYRHRAMCALEGQ